MMMTRRIRIRGGNERMNKKRKEKNEEGSEILGIYRSILFDIAQ